MGSIVAPPEVDAGLDARDAAVAVIAEFDFDALPPAIRLRALERLETSRRRQIAVSHDVIAPRPGDQRRRRRRERPSGH